MKAKLFKTIEMLYKSKNELSTKLLLKTINVPKSEKDAQIIDFDNNE